ncbi:hypothetical protein PHLGIDRAFT_118147 [Phlebiopsis gigantea 11061_1 CR5-6]|uniref:Acyl-coenzyme A oxidase N-terminal domain-containing protein n=1 Tax=Phlebiopsis gigantea (strain 11061_1 CR5-6) TaxID=745531 RepID=A0A0C3PLM8_PHLG1|nr:hypothetical protein PHLGIDRAFT_118147 [Phlebiopsis gigantea 11061_1 CR5-6]
MESDLHLHQAWTARPDFMEPNDRVKLAYERARAIINAYDLTEEEIEKCMPRFWDMQCHGLNSRDVGSSNVLFLHRPQAELFGGFLLTEVGHGLDATNIETTATKVDDGPILRTPTPTAAKIMPPTGLTHGFTKLALVYARLIVEDEYRGIHPFLVTLCTGRGMCTGISSSTLPLRAGTSPLDYAITTFDQVRLPPASFLGKSLAKPKDPKALLLRTYMWRVTVGIMSISGATAQGLKYIATIGYD